jgi:hypothetical protein
MKLTKDQIQKAVLGVLLFAGIVYGYFEFLLSPLTSGREAAVKEMEELEPKISAARGQIVKVKRAEADAPASLNLLEQVKAMIPGGAPIAWVPTKISELFRREGIEKVTARMIGDLNDKTMPGFGRLSWAVEVPRAEFLTLASAISSIENSEPLMEVQAIEVEVGRDDVQFQRAALTINNIIHP